MHPWVEPPNSITTGNNTVISSDIIVVGGIKYKAIKPTDSYCGSCDLNGRVDGFKCHEMPKANSCLGKDRKDGEYINYQKISE